MNSSNGLAVFTDCGVVDGEGEGLWKENLQRRLLLLLPTMVFEFNNKCFL